MAEKSDKFERCVKAVKAKACPKGAKTMKECKYNPYAVCTASLRRGRKRQK